MGTIGMGEIIFLALLALLIFGPEKLPRIASQVGKTVGQLRREASGTLEELKRTADLGEFKEVGQELRRTGEELRRAGADVRGQLDGAVSMSGRPGASVPSASSASTEYRAPPPYDPDAT